jgi:hypothetical protein
VGATLGGYDSYSEYCICLPHRLIVHYLANTDRNGHGTHVLETVDGAQYGVSSVSLIDVKVMKDGGGGA